MSNGLRKPEWCLFAVVALLPILLCDYSLTVTDPAALSPIRLPSGASVGGEEEPSHYDCEGNPISQQDYGDLMALQAVYADLYADMQFAIPFDVCADHTLLSFDQEPAFYEDVLIPEAQNPNDANDIYPAELRDAPQIGQRISGRRFWSA